MGRFDASTVESVWRKGRIVEGYDSNTIRKDACGAWIVKDRYGDAGNLFGWEVDHIFPFSLGGDDDILNLRPMNCANNRSKGNDYPSYISEITAEGENNVFKRQSLVVNQILREQLIKRYGR